MDASLSIMSNSAFIALHAAKHGSDSPEAELANRTLHVHELSQSLKSHKFCIAFERLASDAVNGIALSLLCIPRPDQDFVPLVISTILSIEKFFERKLSQSYFQRLWRQRSDQIKVAGYRGTLRQQLSILGLGDMMSFEGHLNQIQRNQGRIQHSASTALQSRQEEPFVRHGGPGNMDSHHVLFPGSSPSQLANTMGPGIPISPAPQRSHLNALPMANAPLPPLTPSTATHSQYPTILGSQVTIFVIDQLIANFPNITENHDSGNVTTTTMTGSANDSSIQYH
ncbi:hypothetical protein BDZ94DRAFT_1266588 [Collybia nuda]|uniref:Uncharacterized protein n=1 Tax=Collybia nuda TaxID=64659 RepID=A0A9P6CFF5_9AGAR|nr:hypothetical protein BDZ94DRAFT_1266588 [Collybia nuda]